MLTFDNHLNACDLQITPFKLPYSMVQAPLCSDKISPKAMNLYEKKLDPL